MRYSCSPSPGSCFITSKTPPGTNRVASLKVTISPILNLWAAIGSMPFRADNRRVVILTQLTRGPHAAKCPDLADRLASSQGLAALRNFDPANVTYGSKPE